MKNLTKFAILFVLAGVTVTSCKKKEKPVDETTQETNLEDTQDSSVVDWNDAYPNADSLNAAPVFTEEMAVTAEPIKHDASKPNQTFNKKAEASAPAQVYKPEGGHIVTDQKNNLVGGVLFASISEKDTLELHFTDVDTVFTPEKKTRHRVKGYGYIQNKKYSFNQPLNVTKSAEAIAINDTIMLSPEITTVAKDGEGSENTDTEKGDPYRVIIRTRSDNGKVVKLKDLKTHVSTRRVYDRHGKLVKTHSKGGKKTDREATKEREEEEMNNQ